MSTQRPPPSASHTHHSQLHAHPPACSTTDAASRVAVRIWLLDRCTRRVNGLGVRGRRRALASSSAWRCAIGRPRLPPLTRGDCPALGYACGYICVRPCGSAHQHINAPPARVHARTHVQTRAPPYVVTYDALAFALRYTVMHHVIHNSSHVSHVRDTLCTVMCSRRTDIRAIARMSVLRIYTVYCIAAVWRVASATVANAPHPGKLGPTRHGVEWPARGNHVREHILGVPAAHRGPRSARLD